MITQQDDIAMMKNPWKWPRWPALPVKHRTKRDKGWPVCGTFFALKGKPTVYELSVFDMEAIENIEQQRKHEYNSIEELAADWMVD